MRKGRQIDRSWDIRKYKGDGALYAHCKCGFEYCCSSSKRNEDGSWTLKQYINSYKIFHYCPNCGAHKKWYNTTEKKLINFNGNNFLTLYKNYDIINILKEEKINERLS